MKLFSYMSIGVGPRRQRLVLPDLNAEQEAYVQEIIDTIFDIINDEHQVFSLNPQQYRADWISLNINDVVSQRNSMLTQVGFMFEKQAVSTIVNVDAAAWPDDSESGPWLWVEHDIDISKAHTRAEIADLFYEELKWCVRVRISGAQPPFPPLGEA